MRKKEPTALEMRSRERIRYLIDTYCDGSQQQFADRVKMNKASISQYVNGTSGPSNLTAAKIGESFHVSPAWVQGFNVPMNDPVPPAHEGWRRIPILGRIAAGIPLEAVRDIQGEVEISPEMQRRGDLFAFKISGDSMEPKISDGDVVIARQQEDAEDGQLVVALVNGNDACCKRIKKYKDGIALVSTNPAYPPMYFSQAEIDTVPVQVIGVVLELRAPL